jgi:catechol 2,3-dioxygenase-like lactoylglutathione lyase family enzyme
VHLLQAENQELSSLPPAEKEINSRDDHLSFQVPKLGLQKSSTLSHLLSQCLIPQTKSFLFLMVVHWQSDSIAGVEQALQEHGIKYTRKTIDEAGVAIEQVFFHDPDGFMIEICTCEVFPVKPLTAATASICNLAPALSAR